MSGGAPATNQPDAHADAETIREALNLLADLAEPQPGATAAWEEARGALERLVVALTAAEQRAKKEAAAKWDARLRAQKLAGSVYDAEKAIALLLEAVELHADPADPQHKRRLIPSLRLKAAMAEGRAVLADLRRFVPESAPEGGGLV